MEGQKGQGNETGHYPGDCHRQVGVAHHRLPASGVNDELVALQGDEDHGDDGDRHRHALHEGRELAKRLPQDPAVH